MATPRVVKLNLAGIEEQRSTWRLPAQAIPMDPETNTAVIALFTDIDNYLILLSTLP